MPSDVELRLAQSGARSSLYVSREGTFYRFYHDTHTWDGPLACHWDHAGHARCTSGRRVDHVLRGP